MCGQLLIIALFLLVQLPAFANSENDRRESYGNGANNDGAAYVGDQKTKQQLTPRMTSHYTKAQTYFATGNIPMGTMEQMKGDMLKQQINVNGETAKKNRESEKLVNEIGDQAENRDGTAGTRVITVDQERRLPSKGTSPANPGAAQPAASFLSPVQASFTETSRTEPETPAAPVRLAEQLASLRDLPAEEESSTPVASDSSSTALVSGPDLQEAAAVGAASSGEASPIADSAAFGGNPWRAITSVVFNKPSRSGSPDALDKDFFTRASKKEEVKEKSRRKGRPRAAP